ncbi:MAG TPA: M23 family metallopeptidase [Vicinamibacterales bacterium]|nr:M23 family metallopeptidase [Vicinamibacterales bacterium]
MTAKRYTIVLADRASGIVRRFTVSLRPAILALACLFALPVLMGLGARWSAQSAIADLRSQNAVLQMENASYREATGELAAQISSLQTAVDDIGARAIVDPASDAAIKRLPERVRLRAMGGGTAATAISNAAFGHSTFDVMRDVLVAIEQRLVNVRTNVDRRQALASATPSIWPIAGWISSSFGNRLDPFTGAADFHPGLDISGSQGQQIHAPADGVVEGASFNGNYGNLVTIDHGFGLVTRYAHLSRFAVASRQQVRRGQVIGYVGSTGRSTSAHLHYEVLVNSELTNPLSLLAGK